MSKTRSVVVWAVVGACTAVDPSGGASEATEDVQLAPGVAVVQVGFDRVDASDGLSCGALRSMGAGAPFLALGRDARGTLRSVGLIDPDQTSCAVDDASTAQAAVVLAASGADLAPASIRARLAAARSLDLGRTASALARAGGLMHLDAEVGAQVGADLRRATEQVRTATWALDVAPQLVSATAHTQGVDVVFDPVTPEQSGAPLSGTMAFTSGQSEYRAVIFGTDQVRFVRSPAMPHFFVRVTMGSDPFFADIDEAAPSRSWSVPLSALDDTDPRAVPFTVISPTLAFWDTWGESLEQTLVRGKVTQATYMGALQEAVGLLVPGFLTIPFDTFSVCGSVSCCADLQSAAEDALTAIDGTSGGDFWDKAGAGLQAFLDVAAVDTGSGVETGWAVSCLSLAATNADLIDAFEVVDHLFTLVNLTGIAGSAVAGPGHEDWTVDACDLAGCTAPSCDWLGGGLTCGVAASCTVDATCDDGNACNGVEVCAGSTCAAGLPPVCGWGETCAPSQGCVPSGDEPQVAVDPIPLVLDRCGWEGGTGFPPETEVTLVFEDPTAGLQAREVVTTDSRGAFDWYFGLRCGLPDATDRTNALLDRVDPLRAGFSGRPSRFWAEYWDGTLHQTAAVDHTLDFLALDGGCIGDACLIDACGGTCVGTEVCTLGLCEVAGPAVTTVSGDLTTATTWTAAMSPVRITRDISVRAPLTVEAGVVVLLDDQVDVWVSTGAMHVMGTQELPVLFTATGGLNGGWSGLGFTGAPGSLSSELHHVEFRHGGSNACCATDLDFPLTIRADHAPQMDHLRFDGNRVDAIRLFPDTARATSTLPAVPGVSYFVDGDIDVPDGVTWTLEPGVILKFGAIDDDLLVHGRLLSLGTPQDPVVFTSDVDDSVGGHLYDTASSTAPGQWGATVVYGGDGDPASLLQNTVIRFGGSNACCSTDFDHALITDARSGLRTDNLVLEHNRRNGIGLFPGTYGADVHLTETGNAYYLYGDVEIAAGATWTIDPGVVIKAEGSDTHVEVDGTLRSLGTPSRRVVFTDLYDDRFGGDTDGGGLSTTHVYWGGIHLDDAGSPASRLVSTTIAYAGSTVSGSTRFPILLDARTRPVLVDLDLQHNRYDGLGLETGQYGSDIVLDHVDHAYVAEADVGVDAGVVWTMQAGTTLKLVGQETDVVIAGRLDALGTEESPVAFSSITHDTYGGDTNVDGASLCGSSEWGGVYLYDDDVSRMPSVLHHVVVSCGGYDPAGSVIRWPLMIEGGLPPEITGLQLAWNRRNAVSLIYTAYSHDVTFTKVGWPWWIQDDLSFGVGATVTLLPGAVVKHLGSDTAWVVQGTFHSLGTASEPVVLTSSADDTILGDTDRSTVAPGVGNWAGISLTGAGVLNRVEHTEFRYAGYDPAGSVDYCALMLSSDTTVSGMTTVHNNDDICVYGGTVDLGGGPFGSTGGSAFDTYGVNDWAIRNASSGVVQARNNDWSTTDPAVIEAGIYDVADDAAVGDVVWDPPISLSVPVPVDDAYTTTEDVSLSVPAPGVLANDATLGAVTAQVFDGPVYGDVTVATDGGFVYTPPANWSGVDTFRYRIVAPAGTSAPATVTLTVLGLPDAPIAAADTYRLDEDSSLDVDAALGVLANDVDPDGDPLTALPLSQPAHGALTLRPDGGFTYVPQADYNGVDWFVYAASDGIASSAPTYAFLFVDAVADPPVAVDDSFALVEDHGLVVAAPGVLANDTGDGALSAELVSDGTGGTLTLLASGGLSFDPARDATGVVSFTYRVRDASGAVSPPATVSIALSAVNDPPVLTLPRAGTVVVGVPERLADLAVADVDAGSSQLDVDLDADNGTLTFATTAGLTFRIGDGVDDAHVAVRGSQAALAAALSRVRFTGTAPGLASVIVVVDDLGHTGSGGAQQAFGMIDRFVLDAGDTGDTGVPDALVLTVPALVPGQPATFTVTGARPSETVWLAYGTRIGSGPCPPQLGGACLGIAGARPLGTRPADGSGTAQFHVTVPAVVPPRVAFQALVIRPAGDGGTVLSDPVEVTSGP